MRFKNPQFVKTAINPSDYPTIRAEDGSILKEVAVVGRSNVGKSSLLNHLFEKKGLVKVSSTPGKTRGINFFRADDYLAFVDLPGYGYAKVAHDERKKWGPMIQKYFEKRECLEGLLLLCDIRRIPSGEDLLCFEWAQHVGLPTILVLTKVDKVGANEKAANTRKILETLGAPDVPFVHYSVPKNVGRRELLTKIAEILS